MDKIFKSREDYLERILILKQKNGSVRSIDIANDMNFSKPSISIAVHKLEEQGFIIIDKNGYITLTDTGLEMANKIYERHLVLTDWFVSLGVDKEIAAEDACKIEHDISDESFEAIKKYLKK